MAFTGPTPPGGPRDLPASAGTPPLPRSVPGPPSAAVGAVVRERDAYGDARLPAAVRQSKDASDADAAEDDEDLSARHVERRVLRAKAERIYRAFLDADAIFVDFHAEATSEKQAMAFFLDGRVTAVLGTSATRRRLSTE